ncbi:MAG: DUF5320 domain-containing protein [Nanoarchaeota archaeon]
MANRDGTGPQGEGPRTGRGLGNCSGAENGAGRGFGCGFGRGRGFCAMSKDERIQILENELKALKGE